MNVPNDIDDYPKAIEQTHVRLQEVTEKLERRRRDKRRRKIAFKMEARQSEASNRTERKAYVKDKTTQSAEYQQMLREIEDLSMRQAELKGRLKRLEGELHLHMQTTNNPLTA
jgi:predicted dienelactone hydrolase